MATSFEALLELKWCYYNLAQLNLLWELGCSWTEHTFAYNKEPIVHKVHQISLSSISSGDSHHTNLFHFPIACRECWGKSKSNLPWMGEQWIVVFRSYDISFLLCKCVKLHIFINTENFFILVICVNLKRIGRWPDNKVIDISDLMTKQQPISKHKKEETQPWRKEKAKAKTKLRSSLNNNDSHKHVQRPSIAKCTLLTIYHDSPTDFTSSQHWTQPTHWVSVTRPAVTGKLSHDAG
jgi:hypothetical protein